jgi:hypothetical protein
VTHQAWEHLLALVVLTGCLGVVVVDGGSEYGMPLTLRFRWSLGYYALRYVTIGCAILLALNVLF